MSIEKDWFFVVSKKELDSLHASVEKVPKGAFVTPVLAYIEGFNDCKKDAIAKCTPQYEGLVIPCKCGCMPEFRYVNETYGHGEYGMTLSIYCDCGLSTVPMEISGIYGDHGTVLDVVNLWNRILR